MKLFLYLQYIVLFVSNMTMTQESNNPFKNKIVQGYQIATGSVLMNDSLILNPMLSGVGGMTWIFESPKNELIILSFYWGVKPGETPKVSRKYKVVNGKMSSSINVSVEYLYYRSKNDNIEDSWTHLKGFLDENIEIDIKRKYPYMTNIRNTEFLHLLDKYKIKVKN